MQHPAPTHGRAEMLAPNLRRILAPNPSPMTFHGTNTYLVGRRDIAVIDPGPQNEGHLEAILAALTPQQTITHIFVTHSHQDHSPLARDLAQETGAPVYGFGPSHAGRSEIMTRLARAGLDDSGEGIDAEFRPDYVLKDGASITRKDWSLTALWTPGHLGNHMCFAMDDTVFCGDLVMGWASSLVAPPDGDLTDFMASCRRLKDHGARVLHSGHGDPITDPTSRIDWLLAHRFGRETAILNALERGPATAQKLAKAIYTDTPADLMPAAARNVLAHLIDLQGKNRVSPQGELTRDSVFERHP